MKKMNAVNSTYLIVIDLLEQIEDVNEIVALHEESGDMSSWKQYIFLRDSLIERLNGVVNQSEIDIDTFIKQSGNREEKFYSPILDLIEDRLNANADLLPLEDINEELEKFSDEEKLSGLMGVGLGLLLVWVLFEAASNHLFEKEKSINKPSLKKRPSSIQQLAERKIISKKEKEWLLVKKKTRDTLVKGFIYKGDSIKPKDIKKISTITKTIVKQVEKTA